MYIYKHLHFISGLPARCTCADFIKLSNKFPILN